MTFPRPASLLIATWLALPAAATAQSGWVHAPLAEHIGEAWPVCLGDGAESASGMLDRMPFWSLAESEERQEVLETAALILQLHGAMSGATPQSLSETSAVIETLADGIDMRLDELLQGLGAAEVVILDGPYGWQGVIRVTEHGFGRSAMCVFFHRAPSDDLLASLEPVFAIFPRVEHLLGTYWSITGPPYNSDDGQRRLTASVLRPDPRIIPDGPTLVLTLFQSLIGSR